MMIISVVCAIIEKDDLVLCAQRSESMSLPEKWEFPGGKVEGKENFENALKREILEELNAHIEVLDAMPICEHSYNPDQIIQLIPFRCRIMNDETPMNIEHKEIRWVKKMHLRQLDWAPADIPIVDLLLQ